MVIVTIVSVNTLISLIVAWLASFTWVFSFIYIFHSTTCFLYVQIYLVWVSIVLDKKYNVNKICLNIRFLSMYNILGFLYLTSFNINNRLLINFLKNLGLLKILVRVIDDLLVLFYIIICEYEMLKINAEFLFIISCLWL